MKKLPLEALEKITNQLEGENATAFATTSKMGDEALKRRRDKSLPLLLRKLAARRRAVNGAYVGSHSLRTLRQLGRAAAAQAIGAFKLWLYSSEVNPAEMTARMAAVGFAYNRPKSYTKTLRIHRYSVHTGFWWRPARRVLNPHVFPPVPAVVENSYLTIELTFTKHNGNGNVAFMALGMRPQKKDPPLYHPALSAGRAVVGTYVIFPALTRLAAYDKDIRQVIAGFEDANVVPGQARGQDEPW